MSTSRTVSCAIHVHAEGAWADPRRIVEVAREAEDAGWDGVFVSDHLGARGPEGALPVADCWVALAAVAAATRRVRIGPMVAALPRYRPWHVALQAATLDQLSNGRLILGVGSGTREAASFAPFGEEQDLRQVVAYVQEQRRAPVSGSAPEERSDPPGGASSDIFDVVIGGRLPDDPERAAATLASYAEAGLTWWVEGILDAFGPPDALRHRVRRGPPRL